MRAIRLIFFAILALALLPRPGSGATYYVRQTVGDDSNDGLSRETAWKHISKLSRALRAGDIAYVGPGLYRGDDIQVLASGTVEERITLIADTTGQHTGDPPGIVMITGAEPVDEKIFVRIAPGVYRARYTGFKVAAVVEMDSDQYRYTRTEETREHSIEKMSQPDVVKKLRAHMFHDPKTQDLYIHTSDERPPTEHELELVRYGNGISTSGQHYVTIIGFTFRHVGDAGINFFQNSGDVIAINNVSYGSRQGIRVYGAKNVLIYGNTFFRNENSGVYFALKSVNGAAIGNVAYENVKGVRWSSNSGHALAIDNKLFDNLEAGVSIENATPAVLRGNRVVNNRMTQLLVVKTEYSSEENCFEIGSPDQLAARFFPYRATDHYKTFAAYQKAIRQDLHSRDGGCGPMPAKLDVHKMHAETTGYLERAVKILASEAPVPAATPTTTPRPGAKKE
jgi:parallel beta-helix repeat protein